MFHLFLERERFHAANMYKQSERNSFKKYCASEVDLAGVAESRNRSAGRWPMILETSARIVATFSVAGAIEFEEDETFILVHVRTRSAR
jgi:hypothetical protein